MTSSAEGASNAPDMPASGMEQLTGRCAVTDLLVRYFGAVDDHTLDRAIVEATFIKDARLVRPTARP